MASGIIGPAMVELFDTLEAWMSEGHRAALATVIETSGSSPRPVGSVMAVRDDGLIFGSVSGGCVEGAVVEEAQRVLAGGAPKVLEFSGLEPDELWKVGLSCGGRIRVLVERALGSQVAGHRSRGPAPVAGLDPSHHPIISSTDDLPSASEASLWEEAARKTRAREPYVWVSVVGEEVWHVLVKPSSQWVAKRPEVAQATVNLAMRAFEERRSFKQAVEGRLAFFDYRPAPERLIVVGAVHIAIPLIEFAKRLGFETVVIDPRASFADTERFVSAPDRAFAEWPQEVLPRIGVDNETHAVLLTHDPKIDDEALRILLRSPVRYIGALGSKTTHGERRKRLADAGFSEEEVSRIHGPIGLDIGARSPEEIALAIMAEIVAVRRHKASEEGQESKAES